MKKQWIGATAAAAALAWVGVQAQQGTTPPAAAQAKVAAAGKAAVPPYQNSPGAMLSRPRGTDPRLAEIAASVSPKTIFDEDAKLVSFGSRLATAETISTDVRGPVPARKWIAAQFQAISDANGGRLKVDIQTFPVPKGGRIPADQTMANVVATLPGTDPNDKRIFVISGHYDSIPANFEQDAPGANDDASGTIVSIECARALAKYSFPATIRFMTVEGEEQGLEGSNYAANAAKAAGEDIAGMLDDDIVGGDQTPGRENTNLLRVFSQGVNPRSTPQELAQTVANSFESDSPSRELARYSAELAKTFLPNFHVILEFRPDRFQRGGDNEGFVNDGYRGIRFTEFFENSQHQHQVVRTENGVEYGDLQKWVSPAYIANVARVNALTLAALASSPLAPEHVYFQAGQQIGTQIRWSPVEGADSYRLLMRPTAQPDWTDRFPAPAVLAPPQPAGRGGRGGEAPAAEPATPAPPAAPMYMMTVPESGDNYFFAIVAVDKQGHESYPTLAAQPARGGRGGRGGATGRGGSATAPTVAEQLQAIGLNADQQRQVEQIIQNAGRGGRGNGGGTPPAGGGGGGGK